MEKKNKIKELNKKVYKSEFHLLIVEKKNNDMVYDLYISKFQNQSPEFFEILDVLSKSSDNDIINVNIMSNGGLVIECQQLINLFGILQKRNNNISAYISSHASSAGAYLFSTFKKRIISPNSRIMFHHAKSSYSGKHSDILEKIKFDDEHLSSFLNIAQKYFTKNEWKRLNDGFEFWLDSEDMLKRGLATDLLIGDKTYQNKKALKKLKKYYKKQDIFYKEN